MTGRVIRILDRQRLVVDLGFEHGITNGTKLHIYSPATTITDLDGNTLGDYRLHKALVYAREVYPRFAVAMPPVRRQRVQEPDDAAPGTVESLLRRSPPRWRAIQDDLNVDRSDIQALEGGSAIAIGDFVEAEVKEKDPADETGGATQAR